MLEYSDLEKTILRKMLFDTRIGGRHLGEQDLFRGFPSHIKGDIPKVIKKLIKKELILNHPTSYGQQYSLNPQKIQVIKEILEE
jgi:hypothetical protein